MICLKNPYISVLYESGKSFGGSQRLSGNDTISHCGCGIVAALDLLLYLEKYHIKRISKFSEVSSYAYIPKDKYNELLSLMRQRYFPIFPGLGMNGLGLMTGMQMFFKKNALPYSCFWCLSDKGLWHKVEEMLINDIPVIMSVGPNFPRIWKNGKVNLFTKTENGEYNAVSSVKAHFITVTGIDDEWLELSSWGKRYYLNRRLYEEYVSNYSAAFVSNILYVKRK